MDERTLIAIILTITFSVVVLLVMVAILRRTKYGKQLKEEYDAEMAKKSVAINTIKKKENAAMVYAETHKYESEICMKAIKSRKWSRRAGWLTLAIWFALIVVVVTIAKLAEKVSSVDSDIIVWGIVLSPLVLWVLMDRILGKNYRKFIDWYYTYVKPED